jgi:NADH-quinone oxidoreductase subunit C
MMEQLLKTISAQFAINDIAKKRDDLYFMVTTKEHLVPLLTTLKEVHGFAHLSFVTCVDWIETGQFQMTYMLFNHEIKVGIGIKVFIDRMHPVMETIHHLWEQARVYQRELHEMFGVEFPGSPGVEEPMILEGWDGPPPMRREFDTRKYSEETYDHRPMVENEPEQFMKEKLYPED